MSPSITQLLSRIVRPMTAWAWRREIEVSDSFIQIEKLHMTPGAMELHIKQNPACAQWVAKCFASLLYRAPNYTELKFDLSNKRDDGKFHEIIDWITVTVMKSNGKTPHQLRLEAELECGRLKRQVEELEEMLDELKEERDE